MKGFLYFIFLAILLGGSSAKVLAQKYSINGTLLDDKSEVPLIFAFVGLENSKHQTITDSLGKFSINNVLPGKYSLITSAVGYEKILQEINITNSDLFLNLKVKSNIAELKEVIVKADLVQGTDIYRLNPIEGTVIYAGKKSEVIQINNLVANLATNNSRQIYGKVPGLNIWESDGAGIQLGIGGRGLNPNRVSNFNTRQNGYDISADALGYPESYYSPPAEGVERIEILRGAASLQY
nr:carboxypeptidase-like regulatory domain-containing protein [Bacteroidota bacterium]